jgi:hypothetical protein
MEDFSDLLKDFLMLDHLTDLPTVLDRYDVHRFCLLTFLGWSLGRNLARQVGGLRVWNG